MNVVPCPHNPNSRAVHPSATCHRDHGCRCVGCRAAHTQYMADYRARRRRNGGRPLRVSASGAKVANGTELNPNAARDKPGPAPVPRLTDAEVERLRRDLGVRPEHIGPYVEPTRRGKSDRRYYPQETS